MKYNTCYTKFSKSTQKSKYSKYKYTKKTQNNLITLKCKVHVIHYSHPWLKPVYFGENLVRHQCWHADELCSGVAGGTMIMVRACRMISWALMVQEELVKYTPNHTCSHSTPHRLIIGNSVRSYSKVRGQSRASVQEIKRSHRNWPQTATPASWIRRTKQKHKEALYKVYNSMLNFIIFNT